MDTLISNIQIEATNSNASVADLLRKVKVVANDLGDMEFIRWVEKELNGYEHEEKVPDYRIIKGDPRGWNPYRGWIPFIINNPEKQEKISRRGVSQSVAELEHLIKDTKKSDQLQMPYPPNLNQQFGNSIGLSTNFTLMIDSSEIVGILDSLRNKILDWSLALKLSGGVNKSEALFKVKAERELEASINIGSIGQVNGSIGNLYDQAKVEINQQIDNKKIEEIKEIINQIRFNMDKLQANQKVEVEGHLEKMSEEISLEKPQTSKVLSLLRSIQRVFEGAGGSLVAQGIATIAQKFLINS